MKKSYKSPMVVVVYIDTQDMICGSLPKDESTVTDENEILSRRGSFWDEEEE